LLISAIGMVEDVRRCITMDFKRAGSPVVLIGTRDPADLKSLATTHRMVASLIAQGKVAACHDVSDGGVAVTIAEMCIASGLGIRLDHALGKSIHRAAWAVCIGTQFRNGRQFARNVCPIRRCEMLGRVDANAILMNSSEKISISDLTKAWRGTLDW